MLWNLVFGILACFSLICLIWQWVSAVRFPLHQRSARSAKAVPVSILKPLKGVDEHTLACLRSWVDQDYPGGVQLLFGVNSSSDSVCELIEELRKSCPDRSIELVVCPKSLGANAKVSKLVQLERLAAHEIVVVSDADVFVPADLLSSLVAPLEDRTVAMVNCFYRQASPSSLPMRLEAVGTNADFWSQVLQGRTIAAQDFALGAVMATRRTDLRSMGGFEALVDHLADDFQLGHRLAVSDRRIDLCPVVVECREPAMNWRAVWNHQVRWQRTIRVCKPVPYALSILANPLLWPLVIALTHPTRLGLGLLVVAIVIRLCVTADLLRRISPGSRDWRWFWLAPLKDAVGAALWLAAFAGNRVQWRGIVYRLRRDGRLERADAPHPSGSASDGSLTREKWP